MQVAVLEREPEIGGEDWAADLRTRRGTPSCSGGSPKPGALTATGGGERAPHLVDDKGGQGSPSEVLGDDEERQAGLHDRISSGKQRRGTEATFGWRAAVGVLAETASWPTGLTKWGEKVALSNGAFGVLELESKVLPSSIGHDCRRGRPRRMAVGDEASPRACSPAEMAPTWAISSLGLEVLRLGRGDATGSP